MAEQPEQRPKHHLAGRIQIIFRTHIPQDIQGRTAFLDNAWRNHPALLQRITWTATSPYVFASHIYNEAERFGFLKTGEHAVVALLEEIARSIGGGANHEEINRLLVEAVSYYSGKQVPDSGASVSDEVKLAQLKEANAKLKHEIEQERKRLESLKTALEDIQVAIKEKRELVRQQQSADLDLREEIEGLKYNRENLEREIRDEREWLNKLQVERNFVRQEMLAVTRMTRPNALETAINRNVQETVIHQNNEQTIASKPHPPAPPAPRIRPIYIGAVLVLVTLVIMGNYVLFMNFEPEPSPMPPVFPTPTPAPSVTPNAGYYFSNGHQHDVAGESGLAIADYTEAIKLNPDFAEAYNNRGSVFMELGGYARAVSDFDRAIAIKPEFVEAYNNRGGAHRLLGDYDAAVVDYAEAARLMPNDPNPHKELGIIYFNLGEYRKCMAAYGEYERLNGRLEPFMEDHLAQIQAR